MPQRIEQAQFHCPQCRQITLFQRIVTEPNHVLHLLLCLVCCLAWMPVWLLITILHSIENAAFLCSRCGQAAGQRTAEQLAFSNAHLAIAQDVRRAERSESRERMVESLRRLPGTVDRQLKRMVGEENEILHGFVRIVAVCIPFLFLGVLGIVLTRAWQNRPASNDRVAINANGRQAPASSPPLPIAFKTSPHNEVSREPLPDGARSALPLVNASGESPASQVRYRIVSDDSILHFKRSVDVRLDEKITEDQMRVIAIEIRDNESQSYDRTFICYYLPGMEIGAGAWATSHFNPGLETRVLGLTASEEGSLKSAPEKTTGDVIGTWLEDRPALGCKISLVNRDGAIFMDRTYKDGSGGSSEFVEVPHPKGRSFRENRDNDFGEFYLINSRGDLEAWDKDGLIFTAKKI